MKKDDWYIITIFILLAVILGQFLYGREMQERYDYAMGGSRIRYFDIEVNDVDLKGVDKITVDVIVLGTTEFHSVCGKQNFKSDPPTVEDCGYVKKR